MKRDPVLRIMDWALNVMVVWVALFVFVGSLVLLAVIFGVALHAIDVFTCDTLYCS